jgi:hypothetical protein
MVSERSQEAFTGEHNQLTRPSPAPAGIRKLVSRRRQLDLLPPGDYRGSKILEHSWIGERLMERQAGDRDASFGSGAGEA